MRRPALRLAALPLALAVALPALPAAAQEETRTITGRPTVENPIVEFKRAPFRTVQPDRPELIDTPETVARPGAVLRRLDKMTGATETAEIAAGEAADLGRLRVAVEACMAPAEGETEGTRAFLQIWDRRSESPEPAFSGWMFADSPALSAFDHPRFDVWVISCTTS